jgi:hypothetical protein
VLSIDVQVALAPDSTYRALVADDERVAAWRMLRRPLVVLIVIATVVPIMAVQRITLALLAASMVSFSFVAAIQLAVGAAVVASAGSRQVSFPRAIDLWFAGHVPYSLTLLIAAGVFASLPYGSLEGLIVPAVIPAAWTAVIVAAFCRQVLGTSRAGARWRAAAHFLVIWVIAFELVALSAGGWFQIASSVKRLFA